jgi:hypothetical protein
MEASGGKSGYLLATTGDLVKAGNFQHCADYRRGNSFVLEVRGLAGRADAENFFQDPGNDRQEVCVSDSGSHPPRLSSGCCRFDSRGSDRTGSWTFYVKSIDVRLSQNRLSSM